MELNDAIKHIIDGNAIVIMGSGASYGAKNAFGEFPSGALLAQDLYALCGATPDDKYDLGDAAQFYEEKFSAMQLISEVRTRLTCASFTHSHEVIYSLPWIRYYTTNYDDVALLSAKKHFMLTSVTPTSDFKKYHTYDHICVHINGHIANLNDHTLHNEFKLTSSSLMSEQNIMNSQWGGLLNSDLDTAQCIVIIGLSLKYDLDLQRIIFRSDSINKTIIIDRPDMTENSEQRLSRFGTVYKIGVDDFAESIERIQATYKPRRIEPVSRCYSSFSHEYHRRYSMNEVSPSEVFGLYWGGQYADGLFHKNDNGYDGLVLRNKFGKIEDAILLGKKYILIHSDMGNGKTACLNEMRFRLSSKDVHVFVLNNANTSTVASEVYDICRVLEKVVILIDDYQNYFDVIQLFSLNPTDNVQFVLAARSAVNFSKMYDIFRIFNVRENESAIFDLNVLDDEDIIRCVEIFDKFGLFGRISKLSIKEKVRYLQQRRGGNRRFRDIMLDVIESTIIKDKITELVNLIRSESTLYHKSIILILLAQVMNLRVSPLDIERITGLNTITDALFKSNKVISELISFDDISSEFSIKSPVIANYILHKVSSPELIISSILLLVSYAAKYTDIPKYENVLQSVISYSHIRSFMNGFDNHDHFLADYYDKISMHEYYRGNHFFWLQYAISCIEIHDFLRAQRYLDTAYGLIPEKFVPFQINNQQALLYLERIDCEKADDPMGDFKLAHRILMLPIASEKDNEINVVRLFRYYYRVKISTAIRELDAEHYYQKACKEAYSRVKDYIMCHPENAEVLQDIPTGLIKASLQE